MKLFFLVHIYSFLYFLLLSFFIIDKVNYLGENGGGLKLFNKIPKRSNAFRSYH